MFYIYAAGLDKFVLLDSAAGIRKKACFYLHDMIHCHSEWK